jgi:uncharacterized protein (DUF2235 family)
MGAQVIASVCLVRDILVWMDNMLTEPHESGFSRGAYVARALAGFLTKCGLLPKDNREQLHFAYELYVREDVAGIALADRFKKDFTRAVTIEFVGVWDTVASVGILRTLSLPFTDTNRDIKTFRHALSLDEVRVYLRLPGLE